MNKPSNIFGLIQKLQTKFSDLRDAYLSSKNLKYTVLLTPFLVVFGFISIYLLIPYVLFVFLFFAGPVGYVKFIQQTYSDLNERIFEITFDNGVINTDYFIKQIENGTFYRKMFLGVSSALQDFFYVDTVLNPGALNIGGMGSGKTGTGVGIVTTGLASSSDCAAFFIADISEKGAGDYKEFFEYKDNVVTALFEAQKLIALFTMLDEELAARGKRFKEIGGASDVYDYERMYRDLAKKYLEIYERIIAQAPLTDEDKSLLLKISMNDLLLMGSTFNLALKKIAEGQIDSQTTKDALYTKEFVGVAQINIVLEEFARIIQSPEVNYSENYQTHGTVANILYNFMKTSRSSFFNIIVITQRATYNEVPSDLKVGLTNTLCHALNSPTDAQVVNLPHAADVKKGMKGRSATDNGFIQFPFFPQSARKRILEKYYKPLKGELFAYQMSDYHKALSGSGSDGMCDTAKLKFVIQNFGMFKTRRIVGRFLPLFGFEFIERDLTSLEISAVAKKDDELYGILIITPQPKSMQGVSSKKIENFVKELKLIGAKKYLIFNFGKGSIPGTNSSGVEGIIMDLDDMTKMGDIIDNQEVTKVLGTYDALFAEIPLAKGLRPNEVKKPGRTNFVDDEDFKEMFSNR